ncbi:MAG: adenosylcobinamide-GDP ribazoletransferase [Pseudomonadota bacterium]
MEPGAAREMLLREAARYFTAQEFLTRAPSPGWVGYEEGRLGAASRYFPLVGLVVGLFAALVYWLADWTVGSTFAAVAALGAMTWLTGALHEDGFADCCDGLGGASDRTRALEIMRDSRIGVYAAIGLIILFALKWSALSAISEGAVAALLIAPIVSRAAMTQILCFGHYTRDDGAARDVAGIVSLQEAVIALAIAAFFALAIGGGAGLLALIVAFACAGLWLWRVTARLGGYTGDVIGAAEQIAQVAVFATLAALWS